MSILVDKYGQIIDYTVVLSGGTAEISQDVILYEVSFYGSSDNAIKSYSAETGSESILSIDISKNNTWANRNIISNTQHIDAIKLNRGVGQEAYKNEDIIQPYIEYTVSPNNQNINTSGSEKEINTDNIITSGSQISNKWIANTVGSETWININNNSGDTGQNLSFSVSRNTTNSARTAIILVRNLDDDFYNDSPDDNNKCYVQVEQDKYYMQIVSMPSGFTTDDYKTYDVSFNITAEGTYNTLILSSYTQGGMFSNVELIDNGSGSYTLNCTISENSGTTQRIGYVILKNDIDSNFNITIPITQPGLGVINANVSNIEKHSETSSCDLTFNVSNINSLHYMVLLGDMFTGSIQDFLTDPRTVTVSVDLTATTKELNIIIEDATKDVNLYYIGARDDKFFNSTNINLYNFDLFKIFANIDGNFIEVNDGDNITLFITSEIYIYDESQFDCVFKSSIPENITQKQLSFRIGPDSETDNTVYTACTVTINHNGYDSRELTKEVKTIGNDWYSFPENEFVDVVSEMARILFVPSIGSSLDVYFHTSSATCTIVLSTTNKTYTFFLDIRTYETCYGEPL